MIACARCGETVEGDEITTHGTFTFPHRKTCGAGIGPLYRLPPEFKKKEKKIDDIKIEEKKKPVVEESVFD